MSKAESAALTLELERTLAASPARVYELITKAEHYVLWFGGHDDTNGKALEWDLRVGGSYRVHLDNDEVPGGYTSVGKFLRLDPKAGIVEMSFEWEGGDFQASVVRYELIAQGKGTLVRFRHSGLPHEKSVADHRKGWEGSFDKIERLG